MLVFLILFLSFFQVSFLGIGGNASAQALLEHEAITLHQWLSPGQMADLMVFCRILPGGTGFNTATMSAALATAQQYGFLGTIAASACATVGLVIPSAFWTAFYTKIQEKHKYQAFFDCTMVVLRPLIPGLIAAAAIIMMRADNFGVVSTHPWDFWISIFLFLATLIGVGYYKINALFMIIMCGIAGWILL